MNPALTPYLSKIRRGEVVACAAEGVWGLSCDPFNQQAVHKLLALKQRDVAKGLILVVGNIGLLKQTLPTIDDTMLSRVLDDFDRGLLTTWLVTHHNSIPSWLTGASQQVAIRLTGHPQLSTISQQLDSALVSTSANPSAEAPAINSQQVADYFPELTIIPSDIMQQFSGTVSQLKSIDSGEVVAAR